MESIQFIKALLSADRPRKDLLKEGAEFFETVRSLERKCSVETMDLLSRGDKSDPTQFDCICAACSLLDDMASCMWECTGGDHSVHRLCGEVSSNSKATLRLLRDGYYDEAFALCRIIGEKANLLCLFCADGQELKKWRAKTERYPLKKFKPASVRDRLNKLDINPPIDKEAYDNLSNRAVHAEPPTIPQAYNSRGVPILGSILQEEGLRLGLSTLTRFLCLTTFFGSKLLHIPNRPKRIITRHIDSIAEYSGICLDSHEVEATNPG